MSSNFTLNAVLTTSDQTTTTGGFTGYTVTGISGTINNNSIDALLAAGGYQSNDNLFSASAPYLSLGGISFTLTGGPSPVNIYYNNGYAYFRGANGQRFGNFTSFTVSGGVPEPTSWAMMIVGVGAIRFAMRRHNKVATRVSYAA